MYRTLFDAATEDLYPTDYKEAHGDTPQDGAIVAAIVLTLGGLALGIALFAGAAYGAVATLERAYERGPSPMDPPRRPHP